ncbi:uncharacterized protein [Bombus fervidus]|uniref:uncharacterized protein n=1 Tax=Bombus fervidus TaxID=203811 RepID=UPI003AB53058
MKILLLGFFLLSLSTLRVQSKPQITRLFPIPEETSTARQETNTEAKPLDKLLGKLRATYNFVFRKPENTSNVEKILAKDTPNPDVEALKLIWSNRMQQNSKDKEDKGKKSELKVTYLGSSDDDWVNDIRPLEDLEPLEPLELQDEVENDRDREVEIITPRTAFQFPVTLSRHLVDWLGSLLGITYGVYSKLARAIYTNNTIRVN